MIKHGLNKLSQTNTMLNSILAYAFSYPVFIYISSLARKEREATHYLLSSESRMDEKEITNYILNYHTFIRSILDFESLFTEGS